jgi:nitrate reductase gamma subunit
MPTWMILAKGPAFLFVLTLLAFGLIRLIFLTTWDIVAAIRRAGDRQLPYRQIALQTVLWLLPFNKLHRNRAGYSIASFSLHGSLLIVSLFLRNHLDILQANIGFSWTAISKPILDVFTLVGVLGCSALLLFRLYTISSRRLSKTVDYLLLLIILNIFVSGFIAGRPWNPIPYDGLMLFHTVNGMILLLVIPFTKIAHCVLFPLIRLGTEAAWHFVPQGGSKVVQTLHGPQVPQPDVVGSNMIEHLENQPNTLQLKEVAVQGRKI